MRGHIRNVINALAAQRRLPSNLRETSRAINKHHVGATRKAGRLIHHAREAGRLLLEVKAALPHGQFIAWYRENLRVSMRQARRYMATSQGKLPPLKSFVSTADAASLSAPTPTAFPRHCAGMVKPDWQPKRGHWHCAVTDLHGSIWVVPDAADLRRFHVSRLYEQGNTFLYDGTRMPLKARLVADYLRVTYGISDAGRLRWKSQEKRGISRAFGKPVEIRS